MSWLTCGFSLVNEFPRKSLCLLFFLIYLSVLVDILPRLISGVFPNMYFNAQAISKELMYEI